MPFGSISDAVVGAVGDIAGGALGWASAKDLQGDQAAFSEGMYKNRYQLTMKDLRKAGLNPILAGSLVGPAPAAPTSGGVNFGQPGTSAVSAYKRGQESRLIQQKIQESKALTSKMNEEATRAFHEANIAEWNTHSAKASAAIRALEQHYFQKYGLSGLGKMIGTLDATWSTAAGAVVDALTKDVQTKKAVGGRGPRVRPKSKRGGATHVPDVRGKAKRRKYPRESGLPYLR